MHVFTTIMNTTKMNILMLTSLTRSYCLKVLLCQHSNSVNLLCNCLPPLALWTFQRQREVAKTNMESGFGIPEMIWRHRALLPVT